MIRWGVVATVKAPAVDILQFAAHHLEQGASRVVIYLDERNPDAEQALLKHPLCRVIVCDQLYWNTMRGKRPTKHQVRQTFNATHAYAVSDDVDWFAHIDVDELLIPHRPIPEVLAECPADQHVLRIRPMEALATADEAIEPSAFKCFMQDRNTRQATLPRVYPRFHGHLKGGFLSHLAGKLFVRTGLPDVRIRIHNVLIDGVENVGQKETKDILLAHLHAKNWAQWRKTFDYRLKHGSYRADLAPVKQQNRGAVTVHMFLNNLLQYQGEEGLKQFFNEVCADTADLRARLAAEDLLHECDLNLEPLVKKYFPGHSS